MLRSPLNLTLLAILVLATVAGFILIPNDAAVAVRWGVDGQVAATLPKLQALLQMPLATAAIWAIFWVIQRYGNRERYAGQVRTLRWALPALTALFCAFQVLIVFVAR
jgi:hypothetical protein